MHDRTSRPAIASKIENMAQYDTIYVGFPIWWYTAPTIINTFLEQYDLSGKKIIPFATSGMSPIGRSAEDLRPSAPHSTVYDGKRFLASVSEDELRDWAKEYV